MADTFIGDAIVIINMLDNMHIYRQECIVGDNKGYTLDYDIAKIMFERNIEGIANDIKCNRKWLQLIFDERVLVITKSFWDGLGTELQRCFGFHFCRDFIDVQVPKGASTQHFYDLFLK